MKFKTSDFFSARAFLFSQHFGRLSQNSLLFGVFIFLLDDHEHSEDGNDVAEDHFEEVLADANNVEELQLLRELLRKHNR